MRARTNSPVKDDEFSAYEPYTFTGWNGETVSRLDRPSRYGYQARRQVPHPVVFLIHGGPQGSWDDGWSYPLEPARSGRAGATGWCMVDFHGSTGYGQGFTDAISGHWGDRPLEDLQKGWAAALQAKASWIDGSRACAAGASAMAAS